MDELRDNEDRAYKKLLEMAEKGNPIHVSLRDFKFQLRNKEWFSRWKYRLASHMAVRQIFRKLQKKGLITLDYSNPQDPKVIINRVGKEVK